MISFVSFFFFFFFGGGGGGGFLMFSTHSLNLYADRGMFYLDCTGLSGPTQLGANITSDDCETMYTCIRNDSGAYWVATDLPGCDEYEECLLVDGKYTCVCVKPNIILDDRCQRELFLSVRVPDLPHSTYIHSKFSSSNTDSLLTMAHSNSFFETLRNSSDRSRNQLQWNLNNSKSKVYLEKFSKFIMKFYVKCTH